VGSVKGGIVKSDLPARTFEFAKRIIKVVQYLDENPGLGRILAKQLIRSGTSIGANVEEGQASQSPADFISKYSIACKEARETHYWLRLISESNLIDAGRLEPLLLECNELIAILTAIIKKNRAKTQ
jgi:four helix bundle protein